MGAAQQSLLTVSAGAAPPATITFVDSVAVSYAPGGTTATTGAIDTSAADFICLTVVGYGASTWTVSDSKGNTWTSLTLFDAAAQNPSTRNYYCVTPTKGSGHTFTLSGASVFGRIVAMAFSGVKQTSPFDAETATAGTSVASSQASGAVVPSVNGDLLIAGYGGTAGTPSYDGTPAFTVVDAHTLTGGADYSVGVAYYVQTTAASINSSWAVGIGLPTCVASLTAFKAA